MQFELFVAARYLRAKRRQAVIGIITVISIVGVAAGVASLIVAFAAVVPWLPVIAFVVWSVLWGMRRRRAQNALRDNTTSLNA